MAQTGYTPIQIYQSSTAANVPSAANLLAGELAINTADGKLFYKDSVGAVQTLASKNTALIGGANSQIQFNISGNLTGSANLTFTGTTLDVIGTITASNIYANSGTVGATLLSGSLVTAAQPNVTSLGTLTSLAVSGISNLNAIANVRVSGGANGQLIQTDGAGNLSFVTVTTTSLSNGNSNISILANANINFSSTGNANVLVVTGTGITVTGNATLGNLTTSNYFTGVLTTAAQPNITSVGTLTGLAVNNITSTATNAGIEWGNTTAVNTPFIDFHSSGNSVRDFDVRLIATGGNVGGVDGTGSLNIFAGAVVLSNAITVATTATVTGNISGANITGTHYGAATGLTSIPGANVTGTVANATFATSASTVTANAQTNITSLGSLTSLTVSGNILSSNVYANTGTIGASLLAGTLSTAAQPNISSLGTLSALTVTGNTSLSGTNVSLGAVANLHITGGTSGYVLSTDGASNLSWAAVTGALSVVVVSGTTQTAVTNTQYVLTNVSATTVTLPASPASGDTVWVTVANSLATNVIARNGQTIMGLAEDLTINWAYSTVQLRFVNSSWRIL